MGSDSDLLSDHVHLSSMSVERSCGIFRSYAFDLYGQAQDFISPLQMKTHQAYLSLDQARTEPSMVLNVGHMLFNIHSYSRHKRAWSLRLSSCNLIYRTSIKRIVLASSVTLLGIQDAKPPAKKSTKNVCASFQAVGKRPGSQ